MPGLNFLKSTSHARSQYKYVNVFIQLYFHGTVVHGKCSMLTHPLSGTALRWYDGSAEILRCVEFLLVDILVYKVFGYVVRYESGKKIVTVAYGC